MSGQWKSGDVAVVAGYDGEVRAVCVSTALCGDSSHSYANGPHHWHYLTPSPGGSTWSSATNPEGRPLLVIDPEDREQVKRLADAFDAASGSWTDQMQAALRSLVTPEPDEPQGLGSVVRLTDGRVMVCDFIHSDGATRWYGPARPGGDMYEHYWWTPRHDIGIDRVLPRPLTVLHTGWTGDES